MAVVSGLELTLVHDSDSLPGGGATVAASKTPGPRGGGSTRPRTSGWPWLRRFLSLPLWAGIAALVGVAGVAVAIAAIFIGSGNSASTP